MQSAQSPLSGVLV